MIANISIPKDCKRDDCLLCVLNCLLLFCDEPVHLLWSVAYPLLMRYDTCSRYTLEKKNFRYIEQTSCICLWIGIIYQISSNKRHFEVTLYVESSYISKKSLEHIIEEATIIFIFEEATTFKFLDNQTLLFFYIGVYSLCNNGSTLSHYICLWLAVPV